MKKFFLPAKNIGTISAELGCQNFEAHLAQSAAFHALIFCAMKKFFLPAKNGANSAESAALQPKNKSEGNAAP